MRRPRAGGAHRVSPQLSRMTVERTVGLPTAEVPVDDGPGDRSSGNVRHRQPVRTTYRSVLTISRPSYSAGRPPGLGPGQLTGVRLSRVPTARRGHPFSTPSSRTTIALFHTCRRNEKPDKAMRPTNGVFLSGRQAPSAQREDEREPCRESCAGPCGVRRAGSGIGRLGGDGVIPTLTVLWARPRRPAPPGTEGGGGRKIMEGGIRGVVPKLS